MDSFLNAIQTDKFPNIEEGLLEEISEKYPYFHLAKSILLEKYYGSESLKYNLFLKNIAAHTADREILFHNISNIDLKKNNTVVENNSETTDLKTTENTIAQKPFEFNISEKHSFSQWLQLSPTTIIVRENNTQKEEKPEIANKLNIIDTFIKNNPKISPVKRNATTPPPVKNHNSNISEELMTETLAKVYFAQKKYEKAIKAYKILSLKYPEKSGLFADQIKRIKITQTHK